MADKKKTRAEILSEMTDIIRTHSQQNACGRKKEPGACI